MSCSIYMFDHISSLTIEGNLNNSVFDPIHDKLSKNSAVGPATE